MTPNRVWGAARGLAVAVVLLLAGVVPAWAQATGTVRGRVVDGGTQLPLAGAQVTIEGTQMGGLANENGDFLILNVPAGTYTVRAQMLGYSRQDVQVTVSAGAPAVANFTLRQSAIGLDEIVVTGTAGQTTRRAIGNSVGSIDASSITEAAPVADVQELLTARTPGLTLLSNSGQAGAGSKIRIRGAGSLSVSSEPVIFVDGIRFSSGNQDGYGTSGGTVQATSALDDINPEDIASIEVIKGPAAATLYGAEAAGGVIQIITKRGRAGEGIRWTANVEYGQQDWTLETPKNYWLCTESQIANPTTYPGCAGLAPNTLLEDDPLRRSYECRWTTDCQPNPLRTGEARSYNLSASGGGESYNYYISGEKSDEDGVFFNNFARRLAGRANFGFVPSEKLNFNVNVGYARSHVKMPLNNNASNSILRNAFRGRAGAMDDPWESGWRGFSPEISNQFDNQIESERTTISMTVNYNPISWFQNKLTVGMDKQDRLNEQFERIDETGRAPWGATAATGTISRYLPVTHLWTVDYNGTVTNDLTPEINSAFSAGLQLTRRGIEVDEVIGEGLVANKLNLAGAAAVTRADQEYEAQASLGFFVQERIGWRDRLFATAAVRVDDNSAFGSDFSLVAYPKFSLSYLLSDEDFFNVGYVDDLKLRFAWGQAGRAPEPFSADRTLAPGKATSGDVPVNQLGFSAYGNPNLKAETGQEFELGFDASLLEGRVGVEATYYNQRTKDALVEVPDPPSTGYSGTHMINIGEIANSGFELAINTTPVRRDNVVWDATLTLGTNKNELISFGRDEDGNPIRDEISFGAFATVQKHKEGYPLGGFWAVDVERDENGNPVLDGGGNVIVSDVEEFVGTQLPTREISLTNSVTVFQNLRFFSHFDYKGGNYQWCAMCSIRNRIDRNTWQVNNPDGDPIEKLVWMSLQTKTHIVRADFLKLRELSATYTLPSELSRFFRASRASVTLAGRNLWMWTKEYEDKTDFVDPEVTFYSQSDFTQLDYGSMPMLRRWTVSMRLNF